jgi:hypothetical protein
MKRLGAAPVGEPDACARLDQLAREARGVGGRGDVQGGVNRHRSDV